MDIVEGNMCGPAMRGSIAQPWSKTPSRTKGTSRNLGDLAFGRAVIHVAGPHGEGDEPKPMMHEREKSDSAVVAVKSTNEAGRPAEEWMEPRAGAKGNVGRSITLRTQCRAGVSHALGHIRYALQFAAKPSNTRGGSRMRESRTSGFVRGAHSNMCPYGDPDYSGLLGLLPKTEFFRSLFSPYINSCDIKMALLPNSFSALCGPTKVGP